MTADDIAAQINELLSDSSNSVVALSGSWGTGKTYLWKHVIAPKLNRGNPPLYVSVFGLRSVADIQNEIVQAAIASNDPRIVEERKRQYSAVSLALKLLNVAWLKDVIEVLASFVVPRLIKDRLLVLDDIERKGDSLKTDDLLGMIDRYKQVYGSRFVLILNQAKLGDEADWAKYREKVIDHEVVLEPTAEEVFDIALKGCPCKYSANIRRVSTRLGLTNIRVVQRILRIASKVFAVLPQLPNEVLEHVAPSLVLLPAIYFKAKDDLPPIDFVLGSPHFQLSDKKKSAQEVSWSSLLLEIGIIQADEFENHLLEYLRSGIFDAQPFKELIARYFENEGKAAFEKKVRQVFWDIRWDQNKSDADLCGDIRSLLDFPEQMPAATVTSLAEEARRLGDATLGDELVDGWIKHYREWARDHDVGQSDLAEVFKQRVDPRIEAVQAEVRAKQQPPLELFETIKRMARGWGTREISSLKAATKEDYVKCLSLLSSDDLALLIERHFQWLSQSAYTSMEGISEALPVFRGACREIIDRNPASRLASILRSEFAKAGLTL